MRACTTATQHRFLSGNLANKHLVPAPEPGDDFAAERSSDALMTVDDPDDRFESAARLKRIRTTSSTQNRFDPVAVKLQALLPTVTSQWDCSLNTSHKSGAFYKAPEDSL